jgi:1,4-dihydroxy-6-naphthoate synthase
MGDGYGPLVVAREAISVDELPKVRIAVPGERTTAFLALSLLMQSLGEFRIASWEAVPFDQIIPRVAEGEFDAGLIIHEGQLTYSKAGLERIVDLGQWWTMTRGLPLPLGGNAIRRDLADEAPVICRVLLDSIRYALEHRAEAIDYAMQYARDMGHELADEFVGMYVNEYTLEYGEKGRQAVRQLLQEAARAEIAPDPGEVDFVEPR